MDIAQFQHIDTPYDPYIMLLVIAFGVVGAVIGGWLLVLHRRKKQGKVTAERAKVVARRIGNAGAAVAATLVVAAITIFSLGFQSLNEQADARFLKAVQETYSAEPTESYTRIQHDLSFDDTAATEFIIDRKLVPVTIKEVGKRLAVFDADGNEMPVTQ